jgi:hypothetical protein
LHKSACITCLVLTAGLFACQKDMNSINNRALYQKSGNTINVNHNRNELYNEGAAGDLREKSKSYGYVRYQKSPIMNTNNATDNNTHFAALDREQLAHIISKFSTNLPNVHDVAALVTDQEVLVAYRTDSKDRNTTADQVKKTAMSVVPRYYHVYVTDNPHLMRDVENLSYLDSTTRNARDLVQSVIKEMKKSPQGKAMNKSEENANGETRDDKRAEKSR